MNTISTSDDGLIRETDVGELAAGFDELTCEEALEALCPLLKRVAARLENPTAVRLARRAAELAEFARIVTYCDELASEV